MPPDTIALAQASDRLDEALLTIPWQPRPGLPLTDYAGAMRQIADASLPLPARAALTWRWSRAFAAALNNQELN
jgi:hypothetical protein